MKSILLIIAALSLVGCFTESNNLRNTANRLGFLDSYQGRGLIEGAVWIANIIIGEQIKETIKPSWYTKKSDNLMVETYLIREKGLSNTKNDMIFVKKGCIFVSKKKINYYLFEKSIPYSYSFKQDKQYLLAIMLLHELGHIKLKHSGKGIKSKEVTIIGNSEAVIEKGKSQELDADKFAYVLINNALIDKNNNKRYRVAKQLSNYLEKHISWKIHKYKTPNNKRFITNKYSHPDFDMRFLIINHKINNSKMSLYYISNYLKEKNHYLDKLNRIKMKLQWKNKIFKRKYNKSTKERKQLF